VRQAQAKRQSSCGSGGAVAYEARGYKQGWADGRAGMMGKPTDQIEPKLHIARFWLVAIKVVCYIFPCTNEVRLRRNLCLTFCADRIH